jgi:hypothetical protein
MKDFSLLKPIFLFMAVAIILASCNSETNKTANDSKKDSLQAKKTTTDSADIISDSSGKGNPNGNTKTDVKTDQPQILIYNFHVTNRCASCIAIEEATTKTLKTYFATEVKQGRIKRSILNVDDEANAKISEKYQAFGSGLFVTRVYKGKETTTDLTGDGFKFAKNKEEKFIEILKNKIMEYLK